MITTGFCKELAFISKIINKEVFLELNIENFHIKIICLPNSETTIIYKKSNNYYTIWKEKVFGPSENFGIESISNIIKIINCIEKNDDIWKTKYPSPIKIS